MDLEEKSNGIIEVDEEHININFMVGNQRETASFRPDQVTNRELKELFRSAADAGPLDIIKLRKGDKLLNITTQLPANAPETPYVLQIVGAHLMSSRMFEADLLQQLDSRITSLERDLRQQQDVIHTEPSLCTLKHQINVLTTKLEITENLSWLGFYKKLPEPVSSEACRRLQYRRKSDSIKRRVREEFFKICDVTLSMSANKWLRSPAFDAGQWKDEELLLMLQTIFIELGLLQKFDIPFPILRNFLYEVYNNYNAVPFHNFRHCFCVAQMMYAIAWTADLAQKIGHLEVLVLIVSCICHDLDHPGYNNIYQINARTELALRYNDISPLENHHCSVAFRVLEEAECNILASLNSATYRRVREGIIRCILATDMARHNEILSQFNDIVGDFDYSDISHVHLLSMVLIKVADISNEARPMEVAEPWLDQLLQEFFKQSDAEKLEGLPVTPFMDRDKITKPSSQCSFIGLVLLPLFESLGELFTELDDFIVQPVRDALEYYRQLNEAAKDERHHRKSIIDLGESTSSAPQTNAGINKSMSSYSVKSKRSSGTLCSRSKSRSIDDDNIDCRIIENTENIESSDPETATEVEISEKTLKFKISTESNMGTSSGGRRSYPGSRKGSREKSSFDYHHNNDLVQVVKDHEREKKKSRSELFSSDISLPVGPRSGESRIVEEFEKDTVLEIDMITDDKVSDPNSQDRIITNSEEYSKIVNEHNSIERKSADNRVINNDVLRCCCDNETTTYNNKSLLSRLRNFTDRLNISFESKEPSISKVKKNQQTVKWLTKSNSAATSSRTSLSVTAVSTRQKDPTLLCKRCNLIRSNIEDRSAISQLYEKRAMTLPKTRKSNDCKNKSWRLVFAREKRSSASLEIFPIHDIDAPSNGHKRNISYFDPKIPHLKRGKPKETEEQKYMDFHIIDMKKPLEPELIISMEDSNLISENIGTVAIRRSSASLEDISNKTKESDEILPRPFSEQDTRFDKGQLTGSLDSMLYKDTTRSVGKRSEISLPHNTKKISPSFFSRFKSGINIDYTRNAGPSSCLQDQPSQSGWISSLTASLRPKRCAYDIASLSGHDESK